MSCHGEGLKVHPFRPFLFMLPLCMRYYIGIHTITSGKQTTVTAIAAEAADDIPEKYVKRETWEIRRLLPASAQVQHPDPSIATRAVLQ